MAGRNTRIQTVNNLCKAATWRLFFYSKYFYSKRHIPPFSFPYNCKRKASDTNTSRKANACTTRAKAKANACNVTHGTKAVRRSVEQIRLTVSGLVTANVQAYIDMQAGKNRPCKAFRAIAYKTAHYMEFVPHLPCKRLNLHCVET